VDGLLEGSTQALKLALAADHRRLQVPGRRFLRDGEEAVGGDGLRLALQLERLELLAERTSGLTRQRVLGAAELYSETGELPNSWFDPSNAPVDPESDTVIERLIDPYAMGRALRQAGFRRTRVQGYWGGASGKIHLRVANAALARLARLAIWSTPTFRIAAYR